MIDEKKLIEQLRESNYHHASSSREEVLLDRTIRIVLEQPKVGEWIPVEERLPEPYKAVLLCYIGFNDKVAYSDGIALVDYNGNWIWAFDENCEDEIKNEVIAWMDLPKPYEFHSKKTRKEKQND